MRKNLLFILSLILFIPLSATINNNEINEQLIIQEVLSPRKSCNLKGTFNEPSIKSLPVTDEVLAFICNEGEYLEIEFNVNLNVAIEVVNQTGDVLYTNTIINTGYNNFLIIDSSTWSEGGYTITFTNMRNQNIVTGDFEI